MAAPLVTIGMPVRNGALYIREALDSLSAQTYPHFRLVVADNASDDGTPDIVMDATADDPRIVLHCHGHDLGAIANFNWVLDQADTPYFMWAACDDVWEPRFIETLVGLLENMPSMSLAFGELHLLEPGGKILRRSYFDALLGHVPSPGTFILTPETADTANLIYGLGRTAAFKRAGGYALWSEAPFAQDVLVVFALIAQGGLILSPDVLFNKRLVPRDYDCRGWSEYLDGYHWIIDKFEMPDAANLHAAVERKRAAAL